MCYAKIEDIRITDEFSADFDTAPKRIQKKIDRLIRMTLDAGRLPQSVNPHPSYIHELWIGYVTVGNQAWRMLY